MDLAELDRIAGNLFTNGLAESSQRSYRCGQRRYILFCERGVLTAVPATEMVLCYFVSQLAKEGLKHRTMKVYLAAVRHLHVEEGRTDPFEQPMNRLRYILRGVKREEAKKASGSRVRLPITPSILRQIKACWNSRAADPDVVMLWAAVCVGFFGFLRAGEMTVPTDAGYDPTVHLNPGDVAVNNHEKPTVIRITIKRSKTDPFRKGIDLYMGKTSTDLCPVSALLNYLVVRGKGEGPLFKFKDGRFLTRQRLVVAVREALQSAGLNPSEYCGHSFRIGAATTAAARGMEDAVIKTLGRWRSLAYLEYIKIPRDQLASYSLVLGT